MRERERVDVQECVDAQVRKREGERPIFKIDMLVVVFPSPFSHFCAM